MRKFIVGLLVGIIVVLLVAFVYFVSASSIRERTFRSAHSKGRSPCHL